MKLGRWILAAVTVAVVAGAAWLFFGRSNNGESFVTVPVRRGSIAAVVAATGTVNPVVTVTVGSQISGQVKTLYADFNSIVKKGQVIARLETSNLEAQVARDRANVASNLAELEKARVEARNKELAFGRARRLRDESLIPQSDYDSAQADSDAAAATVRTAQAAVEQARASLRISEVNLRYATIVSPVDGIVISRNVDAGQTVAASLQAPTIFTIAQDLRRMEVHMNVAESDIGRLAVAQDVTFTVDAYPQERFRGQISEIRNSPTTLQNVVTYEAVIGVDNSDLRLKPGMTANISVVVARREDALLIPNGALRFKPPETLLAKEGAKSTGAGERDGGRSRAGDGRAGGSSTEGGATTSSSAPGGGEGATGSPGASAPPRAGNTAGSPEGSASAEGRREEGQGGGGSTRWKGRRRGEASEGEAGAGSGAQGRGGGRGSGRPGLSIWVLENESPRRKPIVIGITDGSWTEVVSGDIKEADPVITEMVGSSAAAPARTNRPGLGRMF